MGMMKSFFTAELPDVADKAVMTKTLGNAVLSFLRIVAPMLVVALVCAILFNVAQSGWNFTAKPLAPKFEKISPMAGFKRIFSKRTVAELIKSIAKIAVLAWVAYGEYTSRMDSFPSDGAGPWLFHTRGNGYAAFGGAETGPRLCDFCAVRLFLSMVEAQQRPDDDQGELKEEFKLTEGNPQTKSRISQKQRQMSRMRMVQAVKDADVVITNPTHYAVALSYKEKENSAPVVVAKGKDYLAKSIRKRPRNSTSRSLRTVPWRSPCISFAKWGTKCPRTFTRPWRKYWPTFTNSRISREWDFEDFRCVCCGSRARHRAF